MHTYLWPVSSYISKGSTVHLCEFLNTEKIGDRLLVRRRGTLVLDVDSYQLVDVEDMDGDAVLEKQKFQWHRISKYDQFIDNMMPRIRRYFQECEVTPSVIVRQDNTELLNCAMVLSQTTKHHVILRGKVAFRQILRDRRVIWTPKLNDFESVESV